MTPEQVRPARTRLADPEHSVTSIAKLLGVSRSTIYKSLPDLAPTTSVGAIAAAQDVVPAPQVDVEQLSSPIPMPKPPRALDCPTCGYRPLSTHEVAQHREELETVWLFSDLDQPGRLVERWHCSQCQPHRVEMVMCGLCSVTVMLGGDLANKAEQTLLLEPAARWLTDRGWRQHSNGWECGSHRQFAASL